MKKIVMALSLVSTMALAQNIYVGGGISMDMVDVDGAPDFDNGVSAELEVGMVMDNQIGGEVKFSTSLSPSDTRIYGRKVELETTVISVFATYSLPISPELLVMPKLGFSSIKSEVEVEGYSNDDDSDTELAFGADIKYAISPLSKLYFGYTIYNVEDGDFSQLSVGFQQSF